METWDNYPFGEQWLRTGINNNEHRYTGHLRDPETGNEYAGARYYSGPRGRWLSVDPVLGAMSDPQRLNRYAYVLNDPVNLIDPDGSDPERPTLNGPRPPDWEPPEGWEEIEFGSSGQKGVGPGGTAELFPGNRIAQEPKSDTDPSFDDWVIPISDLSPCLPIS